MWERTPALDIPVKSERDINAKYDLGEQRIVTESNREKLPIFVESFRKSGYYKLRPHFQRRSRWDAERQSKLIESFIMNMPVPPVFLYERTFNSYEVLDGQQRITAIMDFYEGRLRLKGLERWTELNGMTYSQLPSKVRAGIDRRSISSIVLLKESAASDEEATIIKQLLFERLNTGGVKLSPQEIRNALYQHEFNTLMKRLADADLFRDIWRIPRYTSTEDEAPSAKLLKNPLYQKMEDRELVLRFFALRHVSHLQGGVQNFLDLYTIRAQQFDTSDLAALENLFLSTLDLAYTIFGSITFRPYNVKKQKWETAPHKAFYDAVMIGLSQRLSAAEELAAKAQLIIESTKRLFEENGEGTFTGRGNTKADIIKRLDLFDSMILAVLNS
jgi:hypothetical protein